MPIFQESTQYGGQHTVQFKQYEHPFFNREIKTLQEEKRGWAATKLNNGICASSSYHWLEFYLDNPGKQYDISSIDDEKMASSIVELQLFLTYHNRPLHDLLGTLHKEADVQEDEAHSPKLLDAKDGGQIKALILEPGIKTLSFQNKQSPEENHSAIILVTEQKDQLIFKLFDSAAGEVTFPITKELLLKEKNPIQWLTRYIASYQGTFNKKGLDLEIRVKEFDNNFASKTARDSFFADIPELNKTFEKEYEKSLPRPKLSKNTSAIFHQPKRPPSEEPTPQSKSSCIIL